MTPAELDGTELWALSALHGPRIVTGWIDGPSTAELPGRLATWRSRLEKLRKPIHPPPEPRVQPPRRRGSAPGPCASDQL